MSLQQQLSWEQSRTTWAQQLNPLIANAITQGVSIDSVSLVVGSNNVIPTTLNRMQQGWFITDISYPNVTAPTTATLIYRSAPFNTNNLTLTSNAKCVISLWVF